MLGECLDPRWAALFQRHSCKSVKSQSWLGKQNGELLALAAAEFDAFVTIDQNLPHQQNLAKFDLVVLVIREARNNPDRAEEVVRIVESLLDEDKGPGLHWMEVPE